MNTSLLISIQTLLLEMRHFEHEFLRTPTIYIHEHVLVILGNSITTFNFCKSGGRTCSLVPRTPFNTPRGKGSLVNIVQHFVPTQNFGGTI